MELKDAKNTIINLEHELYYYHKQFGELQEKEMNNSSRKIIIIKKSK